MPTTEFKKGDRVRYVPSSGHDELGTVTGLSSDESLVFVLYDGDLASKATRKEDLELRDTAVGVHPQIVKSWTNGANHGD